MLPSGGLSVSNRSVPAHCGSGPKVNTADQLEGTFHEAGGFFPAKGIRNSLLEKEGEGKTEEGRCNAGSRGGCRNHLRSILYLDLAIADASGATGLPPPQKELVQQH